MALLQNGLYYNGWDWVQLGNSGMPQAFDGPVGFTGTTIQNTTTRFGTGQALQCNSGNSAYKNLQAQLGTIYEGVTFYETAWPVSGWALVREWYDSVTGTVQVSLQISSQGALRFFQGSGTGTPLGGATANGVAVLNQWNLFEVEIVFATGTGGSVQLRVWGPKGSNASPLINVSSLNTAPSGNAWTDRVYWFGGASTTFFDDWYVLDGTGSSPFNTFLGFFASLSDKPTSDATPNQFSSSDSQTTGNHYKDVNQLPFSSDTKYLYDNNPTDEELFGFPSITATTVLAVKTVTRDRVDAAGARTIETVLSSSGSTQTGTAFQPATNFGFAETISTIDPHTSASWASGTVAAAGSALLGLEIVS